MAYLGNVPARSFISFERQVFTIVNSQTAYTLSHSVTNENDIRLVVNNVVQEPGSGKAYTATGTTLTLSAALTNGTDEMYCVFLGRAVGTVNAPAGSINNSQISYPLAESGATVSTLNRTTNDGSILEVQRQGTTVGSLETVGVSTSGRLVVKSTTFDGFLDRAGTTIAKWMAGSFTGGSDNSFDLGRGTERWNDLFLGGGVYLGGTGSANKLDDYEEGTWTPSFANAPSATFNTNGQQGYYTKVGRLVTVGFNISIAGLGGGSGGADIITLPFAASNTPTSARYVGTIGGDDNWSTNLSGNNTILQIYGDYLNTRIFLQKNNCNNKADISLADIGTSRVLGTITYFTDA